MDRNLVRLQFIRGECSSRNFQHKLIPHVEIILKYFHSYRALQMQMAAATKHYPALGHVWKNFAPIQSLNVRVAIVISMTTCKVSGWLQ